jgi:aspartate kinase
MFEALGAAGINIGMITTSEIKIAVTVDETDIEDAARIVHAAFDLDKEPTK